MTFRIVSIGCAAAEHHLTYDRIGVFRASTSPWAEACVIFRVTMPELRTLKVVFLYKIRNPDLHSEKSKVIDIYFYYQPSTYLH
jgi:hypothetical protein